MRSNGGGGGGGENMTAQSEPLFQRREQKEDSQLMRSNCMLHVIYNLNLNLWYLCVQIVVCKGTAIE